MRPRFKRRFEGPLLSADEKVRQGRVVKSAQAALASTDAVRSFLNTHHETLGGRPLDLATLSAAGLLRVERFMRAGAGESRPHQPSETLT